MSPHILQQIVEAKRREIELLPEVSVDRSVKRKDFASALIRPDRRSIIAEIKPKSPSQGVIFSRSSVPSIVAAYDQNADAISVLCDTEFFGGGYNLLQEVRSLTTKPILAKEFIIDAKQIRNAFVHGADAILLIAAILPKDQLIEFISLAADLDLCVLLEVHSEEEVQQVSDIYKDLPDNVQQKILIGINNRNLDTLTVDLAVTEHLAPMIKKLMTSIHGIIAESGIKSNIDVVRLEKYVQGFLVGTSILRSNDPANFLTSLFLPKTKVKFCGMTNEQDISAAENMNVDFIGFIFVLSSPRHVTLEKAIELKKYVKHAKTVGVFTDMSFQDIEKHITALELDYVQLHGNPSLELCQKFSTPVIQAFRGVPSVEIIEKFLTICPYVLIDKEEGKEQVDFSAISTLPMHIRSRVFLAGGLTPSNVSTAIKDIHPYAVDCARGVESKPGKKDSKLMTSFITHLAT